VRVQVNENKSKSRAGQAGQTERSAVRQALLLSDKTLGCYRECAGKKVARCVRVAPGALPIAWLERSAWLWRLDASQRVLRWGATGVLGGLRVGESLRAPQGTRHQPAGRGAPLPREPPLADSKRTSPCTGSAAHVALSLRDHRGRHRRAPPRRERRESGADRGRTGSAEAQVGPPRPSVPAGRRHTVPQAPPAQA
jgi:hypothetical protein